MILFNASKHFPHSVALPALSKCLLKSVQATGLCKFRLSQPIQYLIWGTTISVTAHDFLCVSRAIVKELVETEEDFAKDMQFVVENYYKQMDNPRLPKEFRDRKGSIFGNFKDISDFHNKSVWLFSYTSNFYFTAGFIFLIHGNYTCMYVYIYSRCSQTLS